MKISAVNNYHFNSINFEGKKTKDIQPPAHAASPVKAIPVALLMAMSPLNAPVTIAQTPAAQTEYSKPEEDEVAVQFIFQDATPDGNPCLITVRNSGESKKNVELHLKKKIDSYAFDTDRKIVDAYRIREIDITPEELSSKVETKNYGNGKSKIEAKYYVIGSGTEYTDVPQAVDKDVTLNEDTQPITANVEHGKYEISKKLYYYLKDMLRGNIDVNEEQSSTFIINGRR